MMQIHHPWPQNNIHDFNSFENDPIFDPQAFLSFFSETQDYNLSSSSPFFSSADSNAFSDLCDWVESGQTQETYQSIEPIPLSLAMEESHEFIILHLVKAYGEAMETGKTELAAVILKRLAETACLWGEKVERLVSYSVHSVDNRNGYVLNESIKNHEAAFLVFYQTLPFGKFAHFSANSMILSSLSAQKHTESLRIIDFDTGSGVQWPPLIESLGRRNYRGVITLTSIKWPQEEVCNLEFPFWRVKLGLLECARLCNIKLEVEELEMDEIKESLEGKQEWLVFNTMVDLPHMGRQRNNGSLKKFLETGHDSIFGKKGVITFGDGGMGEGGGDFGSFLEGQFRHLHGIMESMDWYLSSEEAMEARVVMECLFVAPFFSPKACFKNKWEERENGEWKEGLEGMSVSRDCVEEANELLKERQDIYYIKVEGGTDNQLTLGFMGTPLVKVSCWT